MDTTKTLLKSVKHFFTGTSLSRLSGVARDMTMAYAFGTESTFAAFLVAFRLAHLFRRVLGEGALQSAFIPQFEHLKNASTQRACRFFLDLYVLIILLLCGIILMSFLFLGGALKFYEFSPGNREIISLTLFMMPSLLFICLFGLNSSLLQCEKQYFIPSVAPVFFNSVWISGALLISFLKPQNPMIFLSGTIILACIAQWGFTLPFTLKSLKEYKAFISWKNISIKSQDLKLIGRPLFLGILGVAATQINNALDSLFARYASHEGPAYLWYAIRIQQVPIGLFAIAFSGALLPPLSRALKAQDMQKFYELLKYSIKKCLMVMIPFSLLIFLLGKTGIQFIYGRGQFDLQAVQKTAECLYAYTLGLIPMALILVIAPAFYSQNRYGFPAAASVFSMGLNIVLNAWFVMGLNLGAVSVAIATSLSAWVNLLILATLLFSLTKKKPVPQSETG